MAECGGTVRRMRFDIEVVFLEDGEGDDFAAVFADTLNSVDPNCAFGIDTVEDVVLVPAGEGGETPR